MRHATVLAFFIFIWCVGEALGQSPKAVNPADVIGVVVAQDSCPLRIDNLRAGLGSEQRYVPTFTVRNSQAKSIAAYQVAILFDDGNGFVSYGPMPSSGVLSASESIVVNAERKQLVTPVAAQAVVMFAMIVNIKFTDGSVYSAEDKYEKLEQRIQRYGTD